MSFESIKTSIYRRKSYYMPFTSKLDSASFDVAKFEMPNGINFLLTRELDEDKCIVVYDIEFLRRFTPSRNLYLIMDGTVKSSSSSFYQGYIKHLSFLKFIVF